MVHGKNRIPYWIDRRLNGLAGPEYHAIISFGLPIEPEDSQWQALWQTEINPNMGPWQWCQAGLLVDGEGGPLSIMVAGANGKSWLNSHNPDVDRLFSESVPRLLLHPFGPQQPVVGAQQQAVRAQCRGCHWNTADE